MYYNIYNKEVCDWCVENVVAETLRMFDERQCMLMRVEQYAHEHEKVLIAVIPQHIAHCDANGLDTIRGIPRDQIFMDGMYFEMEPGVWRLIVYNCDVWDAYANFLSGQGNILEHFKQSYSEFVRYYGNYILKDMLKYMPKLTVYTLDSLLCYLNVYVYMVGKNFIIRDITEPDNEITRDLFQGPGKYLFIPTTGWRKLVNNKLDLERLLGYEV